MIPDLDGQLSQGWFKMGHDVHGHSEAMTDREGKSACAHSICFDTPDKSWISVTTIHSAD